MPVPPGFPVNEVTTFITQVAESLHIDPTIALRVAVSEGGITRPFPTGDIDQGGSYGPYQLFMGGGLGNQFQAQTGLNPADPANWMHTVTFALEWAKQNGWNPGGTLIVMPNGQRSATGGGFHGATVAGIGNWEGIGEGQGPTPVVPPTVQPPYTPQPPYNPPGPGAPYNPRNPQPTPQPTGGSSIIQLQPIQVGPYKLDPNPLAAIGARFALTAVALGVIVFGFIFIVWDKTPQQVKDTAARAATEL